MRPAIPSALVCAALILGLTTLTAACSGPAAIPGPFAGEETTIVADNLVFAPSQVTLPPDVPLRIGLVNQDDAIPHSLLVSGPQGQVAQTPVITGISRTEVRFGPLAPGTYQLTCTVHPSMTATLVVQP
ncbi:MAG: cupredoxin domain-containing protein [Chloroflexota bacterium]